MKLGNVCLLTIAGCLVQAHIQAQAFPQWTEGTPLSRLYPLPPLVLKRLMPIGIGIGIGIRTGTRFGLNPLAQQGGKAFGAALIER